MRRLINAAIVVVILGVATGLVFPAILKIRDAADRAQCQNNLKQMGMALLNRCSQYETFASATVPNESLPCGERLSWLVETMDFIEQHRIRIDRKKGWRDEVNIIPKVPVHDDRDRVIGYEPCGEVRIFRCPADPTLSAADRASLTNYVGISGVGAHAAELPVEYPGVGFFGCDRKIKIGDIKDGTANTIAVMETNWKTGPWTAGDFSTFRPLDPANVPYLGSGRPFGTAHRGVTLAAFADGSVHSLTKSIQTDVLEALTTIAGGEKIEPLTD